MKESQIAHLLESALSRVKADQGELLFQGGVSGTTRFADNRIHQNMVSEDYTITCRCVIRKRTGYATTNRFDSDSLTRMVKKAQEIAGKQTPDPDFQSLPSASPYPQVQGCDEETATCTPELRAEKIRKVISAAESGGLSAAGQLTTTRRTLAVMNTQGLFAYHQGSQAEFSLTVLTPVSSGYSGEDSPHLSALSLEQLTERAIRKALEGRKIQDLPPGDYPVILEPLAVGDMIDVLGWTGLGAKDMEEESSCFTGRMGTEVASSSITLVDDATNPRVYCTPFDFEGVPKRRVVLIDKGKARGVVTDSYYAGKMKLKNTGHATPRGEDGPQPWHKILLPGESTVEEMIQGTERGILVTRFWYTRLVDRKQTVFTGMTRDGTFLVENGKVTSGVRDFRFNQNILEALSSVESISKDQVYSSYVLAPALKIGSFRFTGRTAARRGGRSWIS
ncbi:MAG: TldD/PmbA family protein [Armatimonadetes bacterium]|nr:TldD/PmbA family protein [Armatimonadota bacterium]